MVEHLEEDARLEMVVSTNPLRVFLVSMCGGQSPGIPVQGLGNYMQVFGHVAVRVIAHPM